MTRRCFLAVVLLLAPAVASAQSERVEYYGTDALGSIRIVFDAQGNVLGRMDYGPFGEELAPATGMPKERFAGLFRDGEAGLDYAVARNYQFRTGRFNAPDPIFDGLFEPQAWNRYTYALNNPVTLSDPEGLNADFRSGVTASCSDPEWQSICDFQRQMDWWWLFGSWTGGSGGGGGFDPRDGGGGSGRHVPPNDPTPPGPGPSPNPPPGPAPNPGPSPMPPRYPGDPRPSGNRLKDWARCTANLANVASAAGATRSENFLAQTFFGNDFSSIASVAADFNWRSLGELLTSNPLSIRGAPLNATAQLLARAPIGPRARAVFGYGGYVEKFARIPIAQTATGAAAGIYIARFSGAKLLYDAGTFLGAGVVCGR